MAARCIFPSQLADWLVWRLVQLITFGLEPEVSTDQLALEFSDWSPIFTDSEAKTLKFSDEPPDGKHLRHDRFPACNNTVFPTLRNSILFPNRDSWGIQRLYLSHLLSKQGHSGCPNAKTYNPILILGEKIWTAVLRTPTHRGTWASKLIPILFPTSRNMPFNPPAHEWSLHRAETG